MSFWPLKLFNSFKSKRSLFSVHDSKRSAVNVVNILFELSLQNSGRKMFLRPAALILSFRSNYFYIINNTDGLLNSSQIKLPCLASLLVACNRRLKRIACLASNFRLEYSQFSREIHNMDLHIVCGRFAQPSFGCNHSTNTLWTL